MGLSKVRREYFHIFASKLKTKKKMKKIVVSIVFTLMLVSCTQTKMGYVDVEEILKEYKGTKEAEKEINKKSAEMKGQLDQLASEYQAKVNDYYAKAQKMSTKARQEAEGNLMKEQDVLKQRQQQAQIEVQNDGQEKMTEINENIADFVADYAKSNGYTYILGTSEQTRTVLYGDSKSDITDIILDALNDSYKKETSASNKEEEKTEE
tara:strand:+ start:305841 stop:306464 length:624 start_codon:yes stop_codon:yes gene_type:complete